RNVFSGRYDFSDGHTIPALNQSQLYARQGNLRDLPPFSGRPEEWSTFVSNLERTTIMYGYTDEENIERLSKALHGKAREMVGHRLTANNLPQIMNVLRRHFGRPEIIVQSLIRKIRQLPVPRLERIETLISFGNTVQEMAAMITSSGLFEYSYNVTLLQEIVEKLPPILRRDWSHHRLRLGVPTIEDFSRWMETELEAASYNSVPSFDEYRTEVTTSENRKRNPTTYTRLHTIVKDNTTGAIPKRRADCTICQGTCTSLAHCSDFAMMNLDQRWDIVKEHRLCRKCLRSHDTICPERRLCGKNGCGLSHHNLLHRERPLRDTTPLTAQAESLNAHNSANDGVLFQYIPIVIHGNGNTVETVAFFDSGSSGTFVDEELVAELGLKGNPRPLCIRWTGETEKNEKESVQLALKISGSGNDRKAFMLTKVHSIRHLALPRQSISGEQLKKRHEHLKNLPLTSYTNATPRLIIGIDNCHLMKPLRYVEGKTHEPAAVKTQLGWVVFGSCANFSVPQNHYNYHICMYEMNNEPALDTANRYLFSPESLGMLKTPANLLSKNDEKAMVMVTDGTKMWKDPILAGSICEKMQDYEDRGYIRRLQPGEISAQESLETEVEEPTRSLEDARQQVEADRRTKKTERLLGQQQQQLPGQPVIVINSSTSHASKDAIPNVPSQEGVSTSRQTTEPCQSAKALPAGAAKQSDPAAPSAGAGEPRTEEDGIEQCERDGGPTADDHTLSEDSEEMLRIMQEL
uniref:Uncharacterized protein n=1 Tax=Anopheles arabiensis TaxID=7173 RepID=A0A182HML5_ANOAR